MDAPNKPAMVVPSALGLITLIPVDIKNPYCFTVPRRTSKANTEMAHFVFSYMRSIKKETGAQNSDIAIAVPCNNAVCISAP